MPATEKALGGGELYDLDVVLFVSRLTVPQWQGAGRFVRHKLHVLDEAPPGGN